MIEKSSDELIQKIAEKLGIETDRKEKKVNEIDNAKIPSTSSNQNIGRPQKNCILYKKAELRIDKKIYDKLIILAELDGRSTNNYICQILNNHVNDYNNNQLIKNYEQYKNTK